MTLTSERTYDPKSVKQAGEGSVRVENPYAKYPFNLPDVTQEEYDAARAAGTSNTGPSSNADKLIAYAKKYIGTPYKWGGSSPLGFDCSGLVQYVFKSVGIDLPRVSYQQAVYGKRISLDKLRPGDLVAWDNSPRNAGADHIAIYIGNGQIIAAPKPGDRVKIQGLFDTAHAWGVAMNL